MANPNQIVQPFDLPVRKSHSQVGAVTGGTLVSIAAHARDEKHMLVHRGGTSWATHPLSTL
jgi:hypothetical protein